MSCKRKFRSIYSQRQCKTEVKSPRDPVCTRKIHLFFWWVLCTAAHGEMYTHLYGKCQSNCTLNRTVTRWKRHTRNSEWAGSESNTTMHNHGQTDKEVLAFGCWGVCGALGNVKTSKWCGMCATKHALNAINSKLLRHDTVPKFLADKRPLPLTVHCAAFRWFYERRKQQRHSRWI